MQAERKLLFMPGKACCAALCLQHPKKPCLWQAHTTCSKKQSPCGLPAQQVLQNAHETAEESHGSYISNHVTIVTPNQLVGTPSIAMAQPWDATRARRGGEMVQP